MSPASKLATLSPVLDAQHIEIITPDKGKTGDSVTSFEKKYYALLEEHVQFLAGRIADMEHSRALERELAAARARALALERELAEAKRELAALSAPTRSERRDFLRKDE